MLELFVLFFSGLICVGWILDLWFKDAPPVWVVWLLSAITLTDFGRPYYSDEEDWIVYANLRLGLLGELLTCRLCLSQHVAFWGAIVLQFFLESADITTRCGLFLVCALGWPYLLNKIHNITHE